MASGWGCQYLGKNEQSNEWCLKLNKVCNPGDKGCIIYGQVSFSTPNISGEQERKVKVRSDTPLRD